MKRMLVLALWITLGGHAVAQLREIPLPFADTTCFRVQFVDEDHGWVASLKGTIFHTTNGGLTWNTYASPYPTGAITEIRFSTKDYGILWANPDPNAYSGRLYQTFNAGRDWELVPLPYDSLFIFDQPTFSSAHTRFSVNPLTPGYIMLFAGREWRNAPNTAPLEETFYAWTTNGGQQWQTHVPPSLHPISSVFPLDSNRWARFVGSKNQVGILPECAFDVSDDHGQTWVRRRSWMPVVAGFCEFWDAQHGIVLGRPWEPEIPISVDSGSYVTSDGGETWVRWWINYCFTAAMMGDSLLYAVKNAGYHSWDLRPHGNMFRVFKESSRTLMLERTVTAISLAGKRLYALLLDGRLLVLDDATLAAERPPRVPDAPVFTAAPNPARGSITLSRTGTNANEPLVFEIYDMTGRRVLASTDLWIPVGQPSRTVSVSSLPSGVYRIVPLAHPVTGVLVSIIR